MWLDGTGGAHSIRAAVLRAADGQGWGRASSWAAGLVADTEHDTMVNDAMVNNVTVNDLVNAVENPLVGSTNTASAQQTHDAVVHSAQRIQQHTGHRRWSVRVDGRGVLEGCNGPTGDPAIADMLQYVCGCVCVYLCVCVGYCCAVWVYVCVCVHSCTSTHIIAHMYPPTLTTYLHPPPPPPPPPTHTHYHPQCCCA